VRICITGGSGFLGSWTASLLAQKHQVILIGRPGSDFWRIGVNKAIRVITADPENWSEVINKEKPDSLILMHWSGVENHLRNEKLQLQNVLMHTNLVKGINVDLKLVCLGSQAELGPCSGSIVEEQAGVPTTLYGQAKAELRDFITENSLGFKSVSWARVFSTYGNQDNGTWFLPTLIRALLTGRQFEMTAGEQDWSYLHVLDAASAFQTIVEADPSSKIINVGNPTTQKIRDLALMVGREIGATELIKFGAIAYRKDQVMELRPVVETLSQLNWCPKIEIQEGIRSLITELSGGSVNQLAQVQDYLKD